jgi:hypothetical protein
MVLNINPSYIYKNAEVILIVEDNAITTAQIHMDGECVSSMDITTEDGKDLPFTPKNRTLILKAVFKEVDRILAEDEREVATDMRCVRG